MTTTANFGRLERVDLRDCWEHEAADFTPWLASADNIALLGEAIGVELEVQHEIAGVHPVRPGITPRETTPVGANA